MYSRTWWQRFEEWMGVRDFSRDYADYIVAGQSTILKNADPFHAMMRQVVGDEVMKKKLYDATSHLERVNILDEVFPSPMFENTVTDVSSYYQKDIKMAKVLEDRGRNYHVDGDTEVALRCYNLATLYCPKNDRDNGLGRIFARRAQLFFNPQDAQLCLREIGLAIKHSCPVSKRAGLYCMETQCLKWMTDRKHGSVDVDPLDLDERSFAILSANHKIPAGFGGLQLNNCPNKGRYLTTEWDISCGSTVIVEEPFVALLKDTLKWNTSHCSKCFKEIKATIPCDSCVFVSYCSEECRLADWSKGHCYECPCLPFFHATRMNANALLAFRAIVREGAPKIYVRPRGIKMIHRPNGALDPWLNQQTGAYDSNSYHQILYLKSCFSFESLPVCTWGAVSAIKALDQLTNFFSQARYFDQPHFKNLVASLLVDHILTFACNNVTVNSKIIGIYPLISLIRSSEEPTAIPRTLKNGKVAIVTTKALAGGDEILLEDK